MTLAPTARTRPDRARRARRRLVGATLLAGLTAASLVPVAEAATKTTQPVKPRLTLYQPNGRRPQPASPFLWDIKSNDAAVVQAESFEAATTRIVPNNRMFKLLILGSDARPGEDVKRSRGDSIHVFVWNPAFNKGTLIGIPRDSWVQIPGKGQGKINGSLSSGGPELMLQTVNALSKLNIENYALTGFDDFSKMVDEIGGVNVLVDPQMNDPYSGAMFAKGWFAMNGPAALAFNRNRKTVAGGDFGRSANQGRFLLYTLAKLREEVSDAPGLVRWITSFKQHTITNLKPSELLVLAQIARSIDPNNIQNVVLTGKSVKKKSGKSTEDAVELNIPNYVGLFQDVSHDGMNDQR